MQLTTSAPRAPALPLVGNLPHYMRDPLGLFSSAARLGDVVDLRLPKITSFLCSNPLDISYVLVTLHKNFIKEIFMRDLRRVLGDGLVTSEGDFWRRQRRLAQPAFNRDRIRTYGAAMVDSAELAASAFRPGELRDLHGDMMRLTLDIVTRTLFSSDIGDRATDVGNAMEAITRRYTSPLFIAFPVLGHLPLTQNRRFHRAAKSLDALIYGIIERRRASGSAGKHDLLSMLLEARDEDGTRMTDKQVRDEVTTLVLAGHDTTANMLAWSFFLLSQNPRVDSRLASELKATLGGRSPTIDDLPRLAYLDHVVSEVMRLYPPVWTIGREALAPFDLRGVRIPKGAQLYFSQWVVHRNPNNFPDPEAFRPERWEDGLAKRLPKCAYFPFGAGPRACIGGGFSTMEATLVLATFAQRFRFELAAGERVVPQASITLRPRGGLRMKVVSR
jgi:cytochrome P450